MFQRNVNMNIRVDTEHMTYNRIKHKGSHLCTDIGYSKVLLRKKEENAGHCICLLNNEVNQHTKTVKGKSRCDCRTFLFGSKWFFGRIFRYLLIKSHHKLSNKILSAENRINDGLARDYNNGFHHFGFIKWIWWY